MRFPVRVLAIGVFSFCALGTLIRSSRAEDPCRSGLEPGQRPGPYAFVLSTGPHRGQSHCYICETADRPAVVVFARALGDPLAKLVQHLDQALTEHKKADLRAWITFLNPDQLALDPKIVQWSQKHAIRTVPLGVFEDVNGPPSYRLARDADVTVLLFVRQKVVANFAFRTGELADDKIAEVIKAVPRIAEHMR
jgi:hypothetical protein